MGVIMEKSGSRPHQYPVYEHQTQGGAVYCGLHLAVSFKLPVHFLSHRTETTHSLDLKKVAFKMKCNSSLQVSLTSIAVLKDLKACSVSVAFF